MITLSPVELKKAQGNADHLAQLLVKKAVEEEIKLNPFSPEDKEKLEETKKSIELEYYLNVVAHARVNVTELDILALYKENIDNLKDKDVAEVFPQLRKAVYDQKLMDEKKKIVNECVEKYGLNNLLKQYSAATKNDEQPVAEKPLTTESVVNDMPTKVKTETTEMSKDYVEEAPAPVVAHQNVEQYTEKVVEQEPAKVEESDVKIGEIRHVGLGFGKQVESAVPTPMEMPTIETSEIEATDDEKIIPIHKAETPKVEEIEPMVTFESESNVSPTPMGFSLPSVGDDLLDIPTVDAPMGGDFSSDEDYMNSIDIFGLANQTNSSTSAKMDASDDSMFAPKNDANKSVVEDLVDEKSIFTTKNTEKSTEQNIKNLEKTSASSTSKDDTGAFNFSNFNFKFD